MRKPLLSKDTVETFTLLIILSLICISFGVVIGLKWGEVENDWNKYQWARKLDNCVSMKLKGEG